MMTMSDLRVILLSVLGRKSKWVPQYNSKCLFLVCRHINRETICQDGWNWCTFCCYCWLNNKCDNPRERQQEPNPREYQWSCACGESSLRWAKYMGWHNVAIPHPSCFSCCGWGVRALWLGQFMVLVSHFLTFTFQLSTYIWMLLKLLQFCHHN